MVSIMRKKIMFLCIYLFLIAFLISGCSGQTKMKDGFYTAEMSDFEHGWKEYLCIMVKNNTIVYAEFNAKDVSGFIKAWDNAYMENMSVANGTYPNEYTRAYVAQLIAVQTPDEVDAISGASNSGNNFIKLSSAVIEQAQKGDSTIAIVE